MRRVSTDDAYAGLLQIYVGTKTDAGSTIERAGLANGKLYYVRINGVAQEADEWPATGTFDLVLAPNDGNVANVSQSDLRSHAGAKKRPGRRPPAVVVVA